MKHYPGYLFDLDGTLVDTAPDIHEALNVALASGGLPAVELAHTRHWVGHGARVLLQRALAFEQCTVPESPGPDSPNTGSAALERMLAVFLDHYRAHIADHSRPYPGVVDSLEALRARGARLAVVTNKLHGLAVPLLRALELDTLFHEIVGGDSAARPKPAADPALYACERLGLDASTALFVGDSEADVLCARAAGCPVVCVPDGYNHGIPAHALGADAIIDSFRDLV